MANPWFRLYSEFDSDPKVQAMPENMQRRLIMLFCETCRDVTVTISDEDRAFHWRIAIEELHATKELFISKGFCDDRWKPRNWEKRQFVSDTSKERTKRWREKNKGHHETSRKRHGDADVTKRDGLDTDTDSDAEAETDVKSSDTTNAARPKSSQKDAIEAIYRVYPRKVGKAAALKAIKASVKKLTASESGKSMVLREAQEWLYRKVKAYARAPAGNAGAMTPHPATWFNESRYLDDPKEWELSPGGSNASVNRAQARTDGNLAALAAAKESITGNGHADFPGGSAAGSGKRGDPANLRITPGGLQR